MPIKLSHILILSGISILIVLIIVGINTCKYVSRLFYGISPLESCNLYRPSKYVYRLGDMIGSLKYREEDGGIKYHLKNFPNSIVSEYISKTQDISNYDVLKDIVKRRAVIIKNIPKGSTCVIHLRVGDVVNDVLESASEIASRPVFLYPGKKWSNYTPCFKQLEDRLALIPPVNSIVLVAGSHIDCPIEKSCDYLATIKHKLEQKGYTVTTRLGGDPDEDFIFMCMAPSFIASGGRYSKRIANTRAALRSGPTVNGKGDLI